MILVHYSFLDKILFKIFLKQCFSEVLFDVKIFFIKKKIIDLNITGLPRSGTTILLNKLYKTGKFSSLTFQDLPFILSPNIYFFLKKYFKIFLLINILERFLKKNEKKKYERIHSDGIFVSDEMPEAFDEVFWRVFQNKKYIKKNSLLMHNIEEYEMSEYQKYINLVAQKKTRVFTFLRIIIIF